jgi:hypothetical protein
MGQQWAVTMAGTLIVGVSAAATSASHRKKQSQASFKINDMQGRCSSKPAEDLKSEVSSSTPHSLYHKRELNQPFRTHIWDSVHCVGCLNFFSISAVQCPVHCKLEPDPHVNNVNSIGVARQHGRRATNPRKVCGLCFIDEEAPTN